MYAIWLNSHNPEVRYALPSNVFLRIRCYL